MESLVCAEGFNAEAAFVSPAYYLGPMRKPILHCDFSCIHPTDTPVCLDFPLVVFQVFCQCISFLCVFLCEVVFVAYVYIIYTICCRLIDRIGIKYPFKWLKRGTFSVVSNRPRVCTDSCVSDKQCFKDNYFVSQSYDFKTCIVL